MEEHEPIELAAPLSPEERISLLEKELQHQQTVARAQARDHLQTLEWADRHRHRVEKERDELKRVLKTEREALTSWLTSRIQQQEQFLTHPQGSPETRTMIETELGFLRRYKVIIEEGKHRVDSTLTGQWSSS